MTEELILTPDMMAKNILAKMISDAVKQRTHNRRAGQLNRRSNR